MMENIFQYVHLQYSNVYIKILRNSNMFSKLIFNLKNTNIEMNILIYVIKSRLPLSDIGWRWCSA